MHYRCKLIALLMVMLLVSACEPATTSNKNIKPSQTTNQVARSNLDLGIAYLREGAYEKALDKLDKAKEADPNYSPIYNVYGLLYQQLGQDKKAEDNYKKAIRINSSDSSTLNNYGQFLCRQKRLEEAEQTFLRAAENPLYESPEIAIANAGICAYNNEQTEKAEDYFRQALQKNPQIAPALLLMAEISYNQDEALKARGYLQRFQQIARHNPKSLWLGIQVEQELGDADAVSSYALLLKNGFPDSQEAGKLRETGIR